VKTSDFEYELPERAIAAHPTEPRDAARLLVHEIAADRTRHLHVRDLAEILSAGDLVVVNDTRVRPARLLGRRRSGGALELLLLAPLGNSRWRALVKPAKRLVAGEEFELENGALRARAIERPSGDDGLPGAEWIVEVRAGAQRDADVSALLEAHGRMPLPPYLRKARGETPEDPADRERYQTVFARRRFDQHSGAIAAPTAGLHFTPTLLERLDASGIRRAAVTLHVGLGTFQSVEVEDPASHPMHAEDFELGPDVAAAVAATRARRGRVVAIGTTSFRTLESCAEPDRHVRADRGSTRIFVRPGSEIRVVDALFTNFHLPRSTLLMLVSAFAGRERILQLYAEALEREYRFFSYGDAMLLLP